MTIFADIVLDPGGLVAWLIIGLVAGWLAGVVMKGSGYGLVGDLIIGLIGSLLGGFIFAQFAVGAAGFIGSIVVAFIGAILLIAIVRFVAPGKL